MTQNKTIADASSTLAGSTILKDIEMKITKSQLKQIIKEEKQKLLEAMQISGIARYGILENMNKIKAAVEDACNVNIPAGTDHEDKFDRLVEQMAIIIVNIKEEEGQI